MLNGVPVEGIIVPRGGSSYAFEVGAAGVPNLPAANPVTVTLTIGNNTGTTTINANFDPF